MERKESEKMVLTNLRLPPKQLQDDEESRGISLFAALLKKKEHLTNSKKSLKEEENMYAIPFKPLQIVELNSDNENSNVRRKSLKMSQKREQEEDKKKSGASSTKRDSQGQVGGKGKSISLKYSKSGMSTDTISGYKFFGKSGRTDQTSAFRASNARNQTRIWRRRTNRRKSDSI